MIYTSNEYYREAICDKRNSSVETSFATLGGEPLPSTAVINCKEIILKQDSIGIEVDISTTLDQIDTIIINGVEFKKVENIQNTVMVKRRDI